MNAALPQSSAGELRHPHYDLTLIDAVELANGIASVRLTTPPATLTEARALIKDALERTTHVWITGTAALELLDTAIKMEEGA